MKDHFLQMIIDKYVPIWSGFWDIAYQRLSDLRFSDKNEGQNKGQEEKVVKEANVQHPCWILV